MVATLHRLASSFDLKLAPEAPREKNQLITKEEIQTLIKNLSCENRKQLLLYHAQINLEYEILCSKITSHKREQKDIEAAASIAALLEVIYQDYLIVPREVDRLQKEKNFLLQLAKDPKELEEIKSFDHPWISSQNIRHQTHRFNLYGLFAGRFRRLLYGLSLVSDPNSTYYSLFSQFDNVFDPLLIKFRAAYFLPRAISNIVMIIKHTVPHTWMSEEEKALGAFTRFQIQWNARWQELSNDVPWSVGPLYSCIYFAGLAFLHQAIIFSMLLQIYELFQVGAIYWAEVRNLQEQVKTYEELLLKNPEDENLRSYIKHLKRRLKYEDDKNFILFCNAVVLAISMLCAATFIPSFAVLGGLLAVSTTIISKRARTKLDAQSSTKNPFKSHRFFKKEPAKLTEGQTTPRQNSEENMDGMVRTGSGDPYSPGKARGGA